jgi:hypothetical protein
LVLEDKSARLVAGLDHRCDGSSLAFIEYFKHSMIVINNEWFVECRNVYPPRFAHQFSARWDWSFDAEELLSVEEFGLEHGLDEILPRRSKLTGLKSGSQSSGIDPLA